jgi:hypothetical protein
MRISNRPTVAVIPAEIANGIKSSSPYIHETRIGSSIVAARNSKSAPMI